MMRYLHDIMCDISMSLTIHDPFASDLSIDDICNRSDYPWVLIVPLLFLLCVEYLLGKPKFSVLSNTDCILIVISADWDSWKRRSAHDIARLTAIFGAKS